jgi:hypothetical protein
MRLLLPLSVLVALGCNNVNINTPIRVFDRPSDVALACSMVNTFGYVYDAHPLSDCTPEQIKALGLDANGNPILLPDGVTQNLPFLNALVSQSARGELALVNVPNEKVVDISHPVPGFNFIPVGKLPEHVRVSDDGCVAVTANVDSCDVAVVDLPTMYNMSFVVYPRDGGAPKGFDASNVVRRLTPTVNGKPLGARPSWVELAPDTAPALRGWETDEEGKNGEPGQCIPRSGRTQTDYHAWVALPGCELVVELDVSATKGDPSGMTPAEVIRAVHVGKSGAEVVTDLSSISCPSECSGAPMNVPDADGGTDIPDAGERLPSTQAQPATVAVDVEGNLGRLIIGDRVGERLTIVPFDNLSGQLGAPRAVTLETGALGVSVVRVSPRSDAGKFLYAIARDASVRVVDLDREAECETNPDPRELQDVPAPSPSPSQIRRLGCFPLGDPATPRRSSLAIGPGIILPGGALPRDVSFAHTDVPDPQASNVAPVAAGPSTLVGDFTWIISSDGRAYVVDIFDACAPPNDQDWNHSGVYSNHACALANVDPSRCDAFYNNPGHPVPMELDVISHHLRGGTSRFFKPASPTDNVGQPRLSDEQTPFQLLVNGLPKSDSSPCHDFPCLATAPVPIPTASFLSDPTCMPVTLPPRYLSFVEPDRVHNETWSLNWEGAVPGSHRTVAAVPSTGRLLDSGAAFCQRGVQAGDKLVFTGCNSDDDCGYAQSCARDPSAPADVVDGLCLPQQNQANLIHMCSPLLRAVRRYRILSAKQGVDVDPFIQGGGKTDQLMFGEIYEPEHPVQTRTCATDADCDGVKVMAANQKDVLGTTCLADIDGAHRCLRACSTDQDCGLDFQCQPSQMGDLRCMLAPADAKYFQAATSSTPGCMTELKTYEVHAGESFLVTGSLSGFFSDLQADPLTSECEIPPMSSEYARLHQARIPIDTQLMCPAASDPLSSLPPDLIDPSTGVASNICFESKSLSSRVIHFENPFFAFLLEIPLSVPASFDSGIPASPEPSASPSPSPSPGPPGVVTGLPVDLLQIQFSLLGGGFPLSVTLAIDVQAQQPRYAVTAPDRQTVFIVDEGKQTVGVGLRGQLFKLSTNATALDRSFLVR